MVIVYHLSQRISTRFFQQRKIVAMDFAAGQPSFNGYKLSRSFESDRTYPCGAGTRATIISIAILQGEYNQIAAGNGVRVK
jgi:hypothetical protein